MRKLTWGRLIAGVAAGLALSTSSFAAIPSAAQAETTSTPTTCTAAGATEAGPSSFTFTAPMVIHVGERVRIHLSSTFTNNIGIDVTDLNTFSMPKAKPVALTAGDLGGVANGATKTVTLNGNWTPKAAGKQVISAAAWTFNAVVQGGTIQVSCTFDSARPTITRTVTGGPTLALHPAAVRPKGIVAVSGANWVHSSSGTMSLCASTAASARCSVIGKVKTSASGKLAGSGRIPVGTAAGAHAIKVKVGSNVKSARIHILGRRSISLSSTSVQVGHKVTVHGTGWNPGARVRIQPINKSGRAVGKAVLVTANATGNFSAAITMTSTSITEIRAAEATNAKLAAKPVKIKVKGR